MANFFLLSLRLSLAFASRPYVSIHINQSPCLIVTMGVLLVTMHCETVCNYKHGTIYQSMEQLSSLNT